MVGLERGTVKLNPFTNEWERLFSEEKSRLQAAIGKYVLDIQHVGSTSIPGMVAKPIIDIAIAVKNFEKASICIKAIEQLGYEYKGENGRGYKLNLPKRWSKELGQVLGLLVGDGWLRDGDSVLRLESCIRPDDLVHMC